MVTCDTCGHRLRGEVREEGASRCVVHFDAEKGSPTHGERAPQCPGCGEPLDLGMPALTPEQRSPTFR